MEGDWPRDKLVLIAFPDAAAAQGRAATRWSCWRRGWAL
jgi:hypothetical protein